MNIKKGKNFNSTFNNIYQFNPSTYNWTLLQPSGEIPSPRYGHGAVYKTSTKEMFIFGGALDMNNATNDIYRFHIFSINWYFVPASGIPPSPRFYFLSIYSPFHCLFLFGGYNYNRYFNDLYTKS